MKGAAKDAMGTAKEKAGQATDNEVAHKSIVATKARLA
jgi:uncharacterized protein YjbJ (UPF0337 family)